MLAEGLLVSSSRGDKTWIAAELWLSLLRREAGSTWLRLDAEPGGSWRMQRSEIVADAKCDLCQVSEASSR